LSAATLLLFVVLLTLIDVVLATREHEVDHSGKLVGGGRVGAGLVHARAHAAIKGAERRAIARQAHGGHLQRLADPVG
jgi:hypothetical protein